jgi:two-component system cell cycle response regulator
VPWLARDLEPLLAVVAATLNLDGTLIEANAGFLRIVKLEGRDAPIGEHVAQLFLQPNFSYFVRALADPDGMIYRGLLTIGDSVTPRTLRARVWRMESRLRVLAEYDIDELEKLNAKVLELNRNYADAQLQLAQTNIKLRQREAEVLALSQTDPLTGLGNRRWFDQALATEIGRVERMGGQLSAFMADLDHFKKVNDTYGHWVGDTVLAAFGALLREQTRGTEIVARIGGEEFVALMPHTNLEACIATAERIREALASAQIKPMTGGITASFGVAQLSAGEPGDAFLRRVDKALYAAKHAGRNCVVSG